MKNKYQRMSKEEKKKLIIEYKNTEKGKYMMQKLRNLIIIGVISYFYAIYLILSSKNIWNYISAGMLLVAGCIFIVASIKLKNKKVLINFRTFIILYGGAGEIRTLAPVSRPTPLAGAPLRPT